MDLINKSIGYWRKKLDEKQISARELTDLYLSGITETDKKIGAYITLNSDQVYKHAEEAQKLIDAGEARDLTGIPAGLKDNICTDGLKTTCASKMLENFIPPYDATVVKHLDKARYVLLGKQNLDEFAMGNSTQTGAFGNTKNPYNTTHIPGGSSGGGAAAVSAGLCAFAIGSDTGGSIRQPAAFCGVTGLKPTYGRVSRFGAVAYASSFDQIGPIANSAKDCAVILNCIAGYDQHDTNTAKLPVTDFGEKIGKSLKGIKIALPEEFFSDFIDDEVKTSVLNAAKKLENMGAVLINCSMKSLSYAVQAYYLISGAEAASNLSKFDGIKYGYRANGNNYNDVIINTRNEAFGKEVKRRILLGNYALSSGYFDAYYIKALAIKQLIIKEYNEIFEKADVILTPTTPGTAYKIGELETDPVRAYTADICTVTVNIAGLPAISTPTGYSKNGLPIGMSVIGKNFDEATIIQVADAFESGFEKIAPKCE